MFRVGRRDERIDDADTIDGAREIVRSPPRAGAGLWGFAVSGRAAASLGRPGNTVRMSLN